jgi:hypothetical protein
MIAATVANSGVLDLDEDPAIVAVLAVTRDDIVHVLAVMAQVEDCPLCRAVAVTLDALLVALDVDLPR